MVAIACFVLLKERISIIEVIGTVLAFGGVLCLTHPWQGPAVASAEKNELLGDFSALFAALFYTAVAVAMRKMGNQIHAVISPLYFALTAALFSPMMHLLNPGHIFPSAASSPVQWDTRLVLMLLGASFAMFAGQNCLSKAY